MALPAHSLAHQESHSPSLDKLQALVAGDLKKVDALILERTHSKVPLIQEIANHIIASGGKRLRPSMGLACAILCGYDGDNHIALAACAELIHTVTLLHDDVVDESQLRRGKATANNIWGNKVCILAGDYLLCQSNILMVENGNLDVQQTLSNALATIAEGEVLQLMNIRNPETPAEKYMAIISAKTAALFSAVMEIGAVITNRPEWRQPLKEFGLNFGIAFQLIDDALDYAAEQETLGKSLGDDFRDGKITLPAIIAYQNGNEEEKHFWQRTLKDQNLKDGDLELAMRYITRHNGIEGTFAKAREFGNKALKNLGAFPPSPAKDALLETVEFCLQRTY